MEINACEGCGGRGIVELPFSEYPYSWVETSYCPNCYGNGYVMDEAVKDMRDYLIQFDEDYDVPTPAKVLVEILF